jgi:hypothetical protein
MDATIDIHEYAREAAGYFTTSRRETNGHEYVHLRDDTPEWVRQVVYQAHGAGDILPDDWRYQTIRNALDWLTDEDSDPDEDAGEWSEGQVDTSTHMLARWLGSHSARASYCDEYLSQFDPDGVMSAIAGGQYLEAGEVWSLVVDALREYATLDEQRKETQA